MFGPSIKVSKELWERIKTRAAAAGYSSPEEFVQHILEREVARLEEAQSDEEIARKLKGLGYLE
jgi:plasmid stability protein